VAAITPLARTREFTTSKPAGTVPSPNRLFPVFVDHVNDKDFHGQEGVRRSVGLYRRVLSELKIASRTKSSRLIESPRAGSRREATTGGLSASTHHD